MVFTSIGKLLSQDSLSIPIIKPQNSPQNTKHTKKTIIICNNPPNKTTEYNVGHTFDNTMVTIWLGLSAQQLGWV